MSFRRLAMPRQPFGALNGKKTDIVPCAWASTTVSEQNHRGRVACMTPFDHAPESRFGFVTRPACR